MKKNDYILVILALILCVIFTIVVSKIRRGDNEPYIPETPITQNGNNEFDYKMIKITNEKFKDNYMISPLSIAYALSLVKEGAAGNTYTQIDNILGNYPLPTNINIKDKVGIANLLFINNIHKKDISKTYIKALEKKYDSELMFDDFKDPSKINDWIKEKTFDMIPKALDSISPEIVLGVANTVAMDIEWKNQFECNETTKKEFTKVDDTKLETSMMNASNDVYYIESNDAKGIIKDYAIYNKKTGNIENESSDDTIEFEFIAILPNKNIDEYMKVFNSSELNKLLESKKTSNEKLDINYSIPKFNYDFNFEGFKEALIELGISDAFNTNANFSKMVTKDSALQLYISDALHKSHIEISEKGTKAAAVTVFMLKDNALAIEEEKEVINIEFNRPFIYIIKEKNTNNIWFFGTVYEPIKWDDNKNCKVE